MGDQRDGTSEPSLGQRIAAWRRRLGWSQAKLAERIGVTDSAWSQWETGSATPTLANLYAIVGALEITMAQFWGALPDVERAA